MKFYTVSKHIEEQLRTEIRDFMNFPLSVKNIALKEMWQLKAAPTRLLLKMFFIAIRNKEFTDLSAH